VQRTTFGWFRRTEAPREETLQALQVTTRSPLGAVALETGCLLVDHGWIRTLGGGGEAMTSSRARWNGLLTARDIEPIDNAIVVANDAVGGLLALNGGAFHGAPGSVFYFAPDTLDWLDASMGYSGFLQWACAGDLSRFYDELRGEGWEDDIAAASPDQGFALYPPPFAKEGKPVRQAHRKLVPIAELCACYASALANWKSCRRAQRSASSSPSSSAEDPGGGGYRPTPAASAVVRRSVPVGRQVAVVFACSQKLWLPPSRSSRVP
jgi:hypothetical protein